MQNLVCLVEIFSHSPNKFMGAIILAHTLYIQMGGWGGGRGGGGLLRLNCFMDRTYYGRLFAD